MSLARAGLLGKACRVLLSEGFAPNNDATWQLLLSKHPASPPPTVPDVSQTPASLSHDYDILAVLRSFPKPKGPAAGPSGMRVQHLIDAASIVATSNTYLLFSLKCSSYPSVKIISWRFLNGLDHELIQTRLQSRHKAHCSW